jgi:hypothetical protein
MGRIEVRENAGSDSNWGRIPRVQKWRWAALRQPTLARLMYVLHIQAFYAPRLALERALLHPPAPHLTERALQHTLTKPIDQVLPSKECRRHYFVHRRVTWQQSKICKCGSPRAISIERSTGAGKSSADGSMALTRSSHRHPFGILAK